MVDQTFTKRSNTAVVYMCYERGDIIRRALTALFRSESLSNYDVFISQDGGSNYTVEIPVGPQVNSLYIKHHVNLCPGQHHYFVKSFTFDIMGYENLIVIEEDNVVHPDAIQMLNGMLGLSLKEPQIGLVAITDMDNSLLLDEARYSGSVTPVEVDQGHLWVFGLHASRYKAVRQDLRDYFNVIKGRDYVRKSEPPLRGDIGALIQSKGMPPTIPLSQDAFFVNSLLAAGYPRRLTTMVRLFEPLGWQGLHFRESASSFFDVYGRGMYEGRVSGPPTMLGTSAEEVEALKADCKERLDMLYQRYLGRGVDEGATEAAVRRLLTGKLNAVRGADAQCVELCGAPLPHAIGGSKPPGEIQSGAYLGVRVSGA